MNLLHRLLLYIFAFAIFLAPPLMAEIPSTVALPSIEERLADLEAANNNTARVVKSNGAESLIKSSAPGHNTWIMVSTMAVLFMTLPGLCLFYGGLVARKNVLSILAQCMGIACLSILLWWACGYSLSFSGAHSILGNLDLAFLNGVDVNKTGMGSHWISDGMWVMFQLTFAIITPCLIIGSVAERIKFSSMIVFVVLWMFAVYYPFAHMVWGTTGLMSGILNPNAAIKAIDFAGGTVVHMTSGWSALVLCLILGKRKGYGKEQKPPHSMVLCMVGTGMLWVGWYGFNAGSALAADSFAVTAFITTSLSAAAGGCTWAAIEWLLHKKPSVLGFCSGIIAGLVVITPAAAFVTPNSAVIMGIIGAAVPFIAVFYIKKHFGYDDSLDAFGIHGVGGTLGALLTGVFASDKVNPILHDMKLMDGLFMNQIKASLITAAWSIIATAIIALIIKAVMGLRVDADQENVGLDLASHGEQGYE